MAQYCERADTNTGATMLQLEREFGTHPLDWTGRELQAAYRGVETGEEGWRLGLLADLLQEIQERRGEEGGEEELETLSLFTEIMCTL